MPYYNQQNMDFAHCCLSDVSQPQVGSLPQPSSSSTVTTLAYITPVGKHEKDKEINKKNCKGSKGRIFTTTNPQSVCRCVFFSTLKLPPLVFPCGFSPLWQLGKVNKARYLC